MDTHRLESLSDNVFAVAMTLLVFDLRVPSATTHEGLGAFLFEQWPHYIGYVISFVVIALIWLQHHRVFVHLQRLDSTVFVSNVALMLIVVFLPFATSTLASYMAQHRDQRSAAVFFGAVLTVAAVVLAWLWWWIARHGSLLRAGTSERTIQLLSRRLLLAPVLYLTATLLAMANAAVGVGGYAAITLSLLWLLRPGVLASNE
ncbi:MAG TPA: TMEM175 family protein [Acidimicrobiales bacterium]|nr:TMEM175 family protein [Acidimicrobiales bacterium]